MLRSSVVLAVLAAAAAFPQEREGEKLAPYYPTPETIVERMLKLGALKPGEKMFDLGSGDGRIVIMAAQKFKADGTGVEIDKDLWKQSTDRIKSLGLQSRARIVHGDVLRQDYSSANLITVYLLPNSNDRIRPILEKQLKKGTRVVAHDFEIAGWTPDKNEYVEDDGEGRDPQVVSPTRPPGHVRPAPPRAGRRGRKVGRTGGSAG